MTWLIVSDLYDMNSVTRALFLSFSIVWLVTFQSSFTVFFLPQTRSYFSHKISTQNLRLNEFLVFCLNRNVLRLPTAKHKLYQRLLLL
jgi:nitric oxide reductase large subunit